VAEIPLGLPWLFTNVFGVPQSAFDPTFKPVTGDTKATRKQTGNYGSPLYANNWDGVEIYLPVTCVYTDSSGNQQTYELPNPVVSMRFKKKVVETELVNRDGIVSEIINRGSIEIGVKGFIINEDGANELPEDELTELRGLWESGTAFTLKCALTDLFLMRPNKSGSQQVTIRDMDLPFTVGVKNVKAYTVTMKEEVPFNLIELSGN